MKYLDLATCRFSECCKDRAAARACRCWSAVIRCLAPAAALSASAWLTLVVAWFSISCQAGSSGTPPVAPPCPSSHNRHSPCSAKYTLNTKVYQLYTETKNCLLLIRCSYEWIKHHCDRSILNYNINKIYHFSSSGMSAVCFFEQNCCCSHFL